MINGNTLSFYFHAKKKFFSGDWLPKIADGVDVSIMMFDIENGSHCTKDAICFDCSDKIHINDDFETYRRTGKYEGLYVQVVFFFDCNQVLVLSSDEYNLISTYDNYGPEVNIRPLNEKDNVADYFSKLRGTVSINLKAFVYDPEKDLALSISTNDKWVGADEFADRFTKHMAEYEDGKTLIDREFLSLLRDKFYKAKDVEIKNAIK